MKVWLTKICRVLQTPHYRNATEAYVHYSYKREEVTSCCALGELFLRANGDPTRAYNYSIIEVLKEKYRVPLKYVNEVFKIINTLNISGKPKERIAGLLKRKYGRI